MRRGLTAVTRPDDPRVAAFARLRDKDARREGTFVLEGEVVLRAARGGRFRVTTGLLGANRAQLADLFPDEADVFTASPDVLEGIVGFDLHRGVLALAERGATLSLSSMVAREGPVTVVGAVGVGNHDNVGGLFRNAAAFGADGVVLDEGSCDPLYRKAVRTSVGAALRVPFARVPNGEAMLAELHAHGVTTVALTPDPTAPPLATLRLPARRAFVVGTEGPGLPLDVLARAELRARIPMAEGFDSLNVATALGVALYETKR